MTEQLSELQYIHAIIIIMQHFNKSLLTLSKKTIV